jgi:ketosteroid isomerase-like protein
MPSANVEIVRQSLEAFNSKGVDGLASFWHPDVDWRAIEGAPDDVGVFTGEQAMRRYLGEWLEMFDEARNEPEEFIEAGDQVPWRSSTQVALRSATVSRWTCATRSCTPFGTPRSSEGASTRRAPRP